jgi:P-type conjugative transfer protein TrbJ
LPIALALAGPAGSLLATPASAQVAVYDSSNFGQNLLTAARALQQIDNQIRALQNQATMLSNQARNLTTFSFPELQQLTTTLQKIETLMGQAQTISFTPSSLNSEFTRLFPGQASTASTTSAQLANAQTRLTTTLAAYRQTMATRARSPRMSARMR